MEHVIYSQTMDHLEQHDILSKLQHGYQHGYSTGTQLWVIDLFAQGLENRSQVDCISLDFARTFDVVPHQRLLLKMNHYGIRNILPWIRHFIMGRTQRLLVDGVISREIQMILGLGQGTVLVGLLFLIFINNFAFICLWFVLWYFFFCDDTLRAKEITSNSDSVSRLH